MDEGRQDRYPLSISGYRRNYGNLALLRAGSSILWNKWASRNRDTLPTLCRYYVGEAIYTDSGLNNYIERLYSLPDHEIDLLFSAKRMTQLSSEEHTSELHSLMRNYYDVFCLKKTHKPHEQ